MSIVTPSLNMAAFVDATIQSVLAQDYARIEYIVIDGGSTDGTSAILANYAGKLLSVTEPDLGAADAIRKGFARANGSILLWVSADDVLLPGAVRAAVAALEQNPKSGAVYGDADWIDACGMRLGRYPTIDFDVARLKEECFVCQPACVFKRSAYEAAGGIDPELLYTFDWDLWIRMSKVAPFAHTRKLWAQSRMHPGSLTLGQKGRVIDESLELLRRHAGYVPVRWVYGWLSYRDEPSDQFFEIPRDSAWRYARALAIGAKWNQGQISRYAGEWLSGIRANRTSSSRPNRG